MAASEARWHQLLQELAEADAPHVLQEARAGAHARAREIIEDALVDELLRVAAVRSRPRSAAPTESAEAWWAYCVIKADRVSELALDLEGVEAGTAVRAVVEQDLAALVSQVPLCEYGDERLREHLEDIEWLERTARAHEAVLEMVLHQTAIVPLRLCTIYRDLEGVRAALRENGQVILDNLECLEGATEWGVKVFRDARTPGDAAATPQELDPERASGTEYLANRRRARDSLEKAHELCAVCTEEVHGALSALSRQERVNPVQRPEAHGRPVEMVLNAAYLVEQERLLELERALARLHDRWDPEGFQIELTGPWPPYNFVSDSAGMIS